MGFVYRSRAVAGAIVALGLGALGPTAAQAVPPAPNQITQPPKDGCQRNPVGLLTFTSAHWVYVYSDATASGAPARQEAEGTVADTHVAAGDLPQGHESYDLNFDLRLLPQYRFLLPAQARPEEAMHMERESLATPPFAYSTIDDGVRMWGDWIWDCGHWGPQDPSDPDFLLPGSGEVPGDAGTDVQGGESTEFHPWQAIGIRRDHPYIPQVGETELDVLITSDGTVAGAETECARQNRPIGPSPLGNLTYPPAFTGCVANPASKQRPVNDRDYSFFVPAPPKPAAGARLRYRVLSAPGNGVGPQEIVSVRPDESGIDVTVPFNGFRRVSANEAQAYSKAFFVGWDGPTQRLPAQVEVELESLKIIRSLDPNPDDFSGVPTSSGVPPAEWGVTMDLNGYWEYLNTAFPALDRVVDGQLVALGRKVLVNVPAGKPVRLNLNTRECDLPRIAPCPATPEVAEDNDNPGDLTAIFASPDAAVGEHRKLANRNWELTYSVRKRADARTGSVTGAPSIGGPLGVGGNLPGAGTAGSRACADTVSPSARFALSPRYRPTARRPVVFLGLAGDRTCVFRRAPVRRVEIAVGLVTRAGCRFLQSNGRLGRARTCRRPGPFLTARGTRHWTFVRRLPAGMYAAFVRGVDRAGNVQRPRTTRVLVRRAGR